MVYKRVFDKETQKNLHTLIYGEKQWHFNDYDLKEKSLEQLINEMLEWK